MGCASSLGLGFSLANPNKKTVVIDGDGALLMRMGAMPTNAYYAPSNMFHLLLDNHSHDSTGGQKTISNNVDFIKMASASGYPRVYYAHNLDELVSIYKNWDQNQALTFVYLKIKPGSKNNLGRPKITPPEVRDRFYHHFQY